MPVETKWRESFTLLLPTLVVGLFLFMLFDGHWLERLLLAVVGGVTVAFVGVVALFLTTLLLASLAGRPDNILELPTQVSAAVLLMVVMWTQSVIHFQRRESYLQSCIERMTDGRQKLNSSESLKEIFRLCREERSSR